MTPHMGHPFLSLWNLEDPVGRFVERLASSPILRKSHSCISPPTPDSSALFALSHQKDLVHELRDAHQLPRDRPLPLADHRVATLDGVQLGEEVHGDLGGLPRVGVFGEGGAERGGAGLDGGEAVEVAEGAGPAGEVAAEVGLYAGRRQVFDGGPIWLGWWWSRGLRRRWGSLGGGFEVRDAAEEGLEEGVVELGVFVGGGLVVGF